MSQTLIITNNDKVYQKHGGRMKVLFLKDGSYLAVLEKARDLIHLGAALLSHPQAGSMKPNQTPCRSVLLELGDQDETLPLPDLDSLKLIEGSIETAKKFLSAKSTPPWPDPVREDFETIDLSILDSAIYGM